MDHIDVAALGFEGLTGREWLCANSLGGYASSSICGMNTRKYHGLLVAAMAPPVRRMVVLSRVDETVVADAGPVELSCNEYPGTIHPEGYKLIRAFSTDPFPRWAYQGEGFTIVKSLQLLAGENTVCLSYTLLGGARPVTLELRPLLALRSIHELSYQWNGRVRAETRDNGSHRVPATSRSPEVFFAHGGEFSNTPVWYLNTIYRREQQRGYAGLEDLWMPGVVRATLTPGQALHFACSTEPIDLARVVAVANRLPAPHVVPQGRDDPNLAELAAAARAHVVAASSDAGAARRTTGVITHYPWSPPSIRGAMISLAGLLLVPGRYDEARSLLESVAALADGGVLPSMLPEDGGKPVYQGADVSLWFVNAVHQYFTYTGDEPTTRALLPVLETIIEKYRGGTHLGIVADSDGLITTRVPGTPTTWMDAKGDDWVVTPRQGRPVEVNALWYNALRITADLARRFGDETRAADLSALAESVAAAFNQRFWNANLNCLFDVVDDAGADPSVRPNQLFAVSLPYPVLAPDRRAAVIDIVIAELLTPRGLRTLSQRDPSYQGRYQGNVIARDRAYHQGSAFPWLLGPLVTAVIKSRGRTEPALAFARGVIESALNYLRGDGMGFICELFDGDAPHRPGGAPASAPAAAELLRCWAEDVLAICPPVRHPAPGAAVGAGVARATPGV